MSFETEGYALRSVFAPTVVTGLQAEVLAHIDRVAHALHRPFEASEPDAPLSERLDRIAECDPSYAHLLRIAACTDAHHSPGFLALTNEPALAACLREFLGTDPGELILRLRANVPALSEERQHWHSDVALADGSACSQVRVTCWVPLMDAGPDSGGLELIVGRRAAPLAHGRDASRFEIAETDLDNLPRVQPHCPAGSVLFMDRYTPHRALPNHSGQARWSLVIWAKPAAAERWAA